MLGCNSYEVVDLGVMVPADTILQTAVDEHADLIGLSGLITPSLDEMVFVAREMERRGFTIPLLIGGATTSRQHTAVKIAPEFGGTVVHVADASRAVDVVTSLVSETRKATFAAANRTEQDRIRQQHAALKHRPSSAWPAAQANRLGSTGRRTRSRARLHRPRLLDDVGSDELVPYIDWTFFFAAWELKGRFPAILDHPKYGAAARELYGHARTLLDRIVADRLLTPRGVYGFWPANSDGDDIVLYEPGSQPGARHELFGSTCCGSRSRCRGQPNLSLADFVAPRGSGVVDFVGAFAVTAGLGAAELAAAFERDHDDYHAIMVKALADRLAEAFAEYLHARARREWGYGADERLTNEDLIAERYRGIRPAFGYPACPDHSEKRQALRPAAAPSAPASR